MNVAENDLSLTAAAARRLLWTGRPAWFEVKTSGRLVILCRVNRQKATPEIDACCVAFVERGPAYWHTSLSGLRRREDCDRMFEPVWLVQARQSGRRSDILEALLHPYPPDWPRCVCGDPVVDGKATCGDISCRPRFMWEPEDSADRAERALGVE